MPALLSFALLLVTTGQSDAVASPQPDKKLCRRITPTGSMLPRRICLTKAEWVQFHQRNADDADGALNRRINITGTDPDKLK